MSNYCKITLCESLEEFEGEYEIGESLEVNVFNRSLKQEAINFSTVTYKELLISDLKNRCFMYSPVFYNAGTFISLGYYERYRTNFYFKTTNREDAERLSKDLKINTITFEHPALSWCFNNPAITVKTNDNKISVEINQDSPTYTISVNKRNIEKIVLGGAYNMSSKYNECAIDITAKNYAKLYLVDSIEYDQLLSYVNEFDALINAYAPTGLRSYKTHIGTENDIDFEMIHKLLGNVQYYDKQIQFPIAMKFDEYLKHAYSETEYRETKRQNLYLPLDFKKPTSLEDKFTYYLRYIDMYIGEKTKKETGKAERKTHKRIKTFLELYSSVFDKNDIADMDRLKNEINSLRAHYLHEGYYLLDGQFQVTDDNGNKYMQTLDYEWLYRVTQSLKFGTYLILYKEVMGFDVNEKALKHFCTYILK